MEAYLTENCPPTFHFRGRSSVEAVLKGWLKGGLQGLPPCSKNKVFVLVLHGNRGNLRGISEEPIKESVSWQVQGMVREVSDFVAWGGVGGGFPILL